MYIQNMHVASITGCFVTLYAVSCHNDYVYMCSNNVIKVFTCLFITIYYYDCYIYELNHVNLI